MIWIFHKLTTIFPFLSSLTYTVELETATKKKTFATPHLFFYVEDQKKLQLQRILKIHNLGSNQKLWYHLLEKPTLRNKILKDIMWKLQNWRENHDRCQTTTREWHLCWNRSFQERWKKKKEKREKREKL